VPSPPALAKPEEGLPLATGAPPRPALFVTRVRLTNYKSIASCDVRLSPLTVLIGPNGSGKSNFVDALAFLARALETNLYAAVDERGGLPEILYRLPAPTDSFSIDLDVEVLSEKLPMTASYGFEVGRWRGDGFQVVRESCTVNSDQRGGSWRRHREAVEAGPHSQPVAIVEPDRLYLPVAGSQLAVSRTEGGFPGTAIPSPYTALLRGLSGMRFYSFGLDELRQPRPRSSAAILGRRGEYLADVIGALEQMGGGWKERLDAYLAAILGPALPQGVRLDQWFRGPSDERGYTFVQLLTPAGMDGRDVAFGPESISDGTLRAAGVLAALFQPATHDGRVQLVGIEEPETALHPAAAGVLYDALTEASEHLQVIATSQSADLLDREDLDVSAVRSVTMDRGRTVIGEVDAASREIVAKQIFTLGELMRGNQIHPEATPMGNGAHQRSLA
jgi:predicted ATPase